MGPELLWGDLAVDCLAPRIRGAARSLPGIVPANSALQSVVAGSSNHRSQARPGQRHRLLPREVGARPPIRLLRARKPFALQQAKEKSYVGGAWSEDL